MNNRAPKFLFAGDVMLGENVYHIGRGIRTKFGKQYDKMIPSFIKQQLFDDIDAIVYNFEYSLVSDDFVFDDFEESIYAAPASSLKVFPDNILKIVNIANNHFWEKGLEQTKFTIDVLKNKGFYVVGESGKPVVVNIKGKNFYFWGVSLIDWNVPVFTSTYEDLFNRIFLPPKRENDVWIMSVHWGTEFISQPNQQQVELAHKLVNVGFDIVHGHHPHVFQPIEKINNSLVMYSLGNCLFDENFAYKTQLSYMPRVTFNKNVTWEMLRMKNKYYAPVKLEKIAQETVLYKKYKPLSSFKKKLIFKKYNMLRKLEYLRHIGLNNFYVYRSMRKRLK